MADRQMQIEKLTKQKDGVNDEIFADFCRRVGIPNIRSFPPSFFLNPFIFLYCAKI